MEKHFSEILGSSLDAWTIEYRVHATKRMFTRSIKEEDAKRLLTDGLIIEEYLDDFPFPSMLLFGVAHDKRPLHGVVGIDHKTKRLYLITIYEPDPEKWSVDFQRRK